MADLFKEILPSILQTKKDVLDNAKDYNAHLVNEALSYHPDCIHYVNQMNINYGLPPEMQYQYLLNTVRPMKRKFQKWNKTASVRNLESVKEYFGYSDMKAKEALTILNDEDIALIEEKLERGGVT